jgi:hypothetical protein
MLLQRVITLYFVPNGIVIHYNYSDTVSKNGTTGVYSFRLRAPLDFSNLPSLPRQQGATGLWIQRRAFEHQGDFNPHDSRAAQRTLRLGTTSRVRPSSATVPHLPNADQKRIALAECGTSQVPTHHFARDALFDPGKVSAPSYNSLVHVVFNHY